MDAVKDLEGLRMKRDVSVIGPLNVDLLINGSGPPDWESITTWDGPAAMQMTAAGSVGYTVQDMAHLGLRVSVCGCVPDDALGAFIMENLKRAGVEVGEVRMQSGTLAGIGVYMLLFGSRKRPLAYRLPTHEPWPLSFAPQEVDDLLSARLLHNGGYLHFKQMFHGETIELFREARERGVITSLDSQFPLHVMPVPWLPAMEDILPYVDLLFCDEYEACSLTGTEQPEEAAEQLMPSGIETLVIKRGAEGSDVFTQNEHFHQPAIRLGELVDSIGAGDAYDAAFIYSILQGWPMERSALFASLAAGKTVTGVGGTDSMPTADEIEGLIKSMDLE
jgi:sugar/nucleoside kinase (ribokinase family)